MSFTSELLNDKHSGNLVVTVCVESTNPEGEDFYAFINMTKDKFEQFTIDTTTPDGQTLDLTQYGRVVYTNMGKVNDAVKESIADMLGHDIKQSVDLPGPAQLSIRKS